MKRSRSKGPDAQERRHWNRVAALGCLACGGEATLHHVTGYADRMGRLPRSHKLVAPLCAFHHFIQHGKWSVEALGHRGFYQEWGVDLLAEAERLWAESEQIEQRKDAA